MLVRFNFSQQCYFLIELVAGEKDIFDIIVPATNAGTRLLCSIVDNVEALIDEWFPGLREQDIGTGASLVKPLCLCPLCPGEREWGTMYIHIQYVLAIGCMETSCIKPYTYM